MLCFHFNISVIRDVLIQLLGIDLLILEFLMYDGNKK